MASRIKQKKLKVREIETRAELLRNRKEKLRQAAKLKKEAYANKLYSDSKQKQYAYSEKSETSKTKKTAGEIIALVIGIAVISVLVVLYASRTLGGIF